MTRKEVLSCLKDCGAQNDRARWLRLYVENRVSYGVASKAWQDGAALRRFVEKRDAQALTQGATPNV